MYKLLALDMDGTLLASDKSILPETAAAIRRLKDQGIAIAFCTGRGIPELTEYQEVLDTLPYGILVSGAMIYDYKAAKPVTVKALTTDQVLKILDQGEAEHAMPHFLSVMESVARERDIKRMPDFNMAIYQSLFEKVALRCDDMPAYAAAHEGEITKLNLYHPSVEARERSREKLSDLGIYLAYTEISTLECTAPGISKGVGIRLLCDYLGIDTAEAVAVGDSGNDIDALRTAGLAVAMGNATEEIKAAADVVVADNDHNGIVEVIERYF